MDIKELEAKIDKANDKFISEEEVEQAGGPADLYQSKVNARLAESKKRRPHGCPVIVKTVAKSVIEGDGARGAGLAPAYHRAKDDSDYFKERGEMDRAEIVRNQYMEEHFLPAVEAIIAYSSPDELLNSKDVLDALDKFVLGTGSSKGYTAQYVRSSYGNALGEDYSNRIGRSDDAVTGAVMRIKFLSEHGQNREAVGIAESMKKQIDNGNHVASDDDYALIGRVAAFGR